MALMEFSCCFMAKYDLEHIFLEWSIAILNTKITIHYFQYALTEICKFCSFAYSQPQFTLLWCHSCNAALWEVSTWSLHCWRTAAAHCPSLATPSWIHCSQTGSWIPPCLASWCRDLEWLPCEVDPWNTGIL